MVVSKTKGTPKWMVKIMENPITVRWFGGTTIFGNIHIQIWCFKWKSLEAFPPWISKCRVFTRMKFPGQWPELQEPQDEWTHLRMILLDVNLTSSKPPKNPREPLPHYLSTRDEVQEEGEGFRRSCSVCFKASKTIRKENVPTTWSCDDV